MLARLRGVNPRIDRFMDTAGRWMHADPPSTYKGSKQPASKQFLRSLKVTNYAGPTDVEAAAEGGLCCALRSDQCIKLGAACMCGCVTAARTQLLLILKLVGCTIQLPASFSHLLYVKVIAPTSTLLCPCLVPDSSLHLRQSADIPCIMCFAACSPALLQTAAPSAAASMRRGRQ